MVHLSLTSSTGMHKKEAAVRVTYSDLHNSCHPIMGLSCLLIEGFVWNCAFFALWWLGFKSFSAISFSTWLVFLCAGVAIFLTWKRFIDSTALSSAVLSPAGGNVCFRIEEQRFFSSMCYLLGIVQLVPSDETEPHSCSLLTAYNFFLGGQWFLSLAVQHVMRTQCLCHWWLEY